MIILALDIGMSKFDCLKWSTFTTVTFQFCEGKHKSKAIENSNNNSILRGKIEKRIRYAGKMLAKPKIESNTQNTQKTSEHILRTRLCGRRAGGSIGYWFIWSRIQTQGHCKHDEKKSEIERQKPVLKLNSRTAGTAIGLIAKTFRKCMFQYWVTAANEWGLIKHLHSS